MFWRSDLDVGLPLAREKHTGMHVGTQPRTLPLIVLSARSPRTQPGSLWDYVGSCSACACAFCIVELSGGLDREWSSCAPGAQELVAGMRRMIRSVHGDRVERLPPCAM